MLSVDDFARFFAAVYGHEPFPWQQRLIEKVTSDGKWPEVLNLPTGAGKTAAIDIAAFHLALEVERGDTRRAPVRIALVVDRRLIVDDAYARARRLATALESAARGTVVAGVADRLRSLSGGSPLIVRRLRGGIPREDDWARTPSQPTVLCSTVDQVGSRILFRGYGVSDSMKPVHAGLLGSDCLILLDEAHLAEPFRQTLNWIHGYRRKAWREVEYAGPWGMCLLTATPAGESRAHFSLKHEDQSHPILRKRLEASKPVRLIITPAHSRQAVGVTGENTEFSSDTDLHYRIGAILMEVRRALGHFRDPAHGASAPAIGVVVNRVGRARQILEKLREELAQDNLGIVDLVLMIGPARPADRDTLAESLEPIRTRAWVEGERRILARPLVIVATQCLEAGVDIDLDGLITDAAPLDALRQRFGRLNRAGREITPYGAIVAGRAELSSKYRDPVYGTAIKEAWDCLLKASSKGRKVKGDRTPIIAFGLNEFSVPLTSKALSPKADAPVLMPAHVDLLSQTAPIPAADPDVSLYLHGAERRSDSLTVVWRADIDPTYQSDEEVRRLLKLVPPRPAEAIELPAWAIRRWLAEDRSPLADGLADVAMAAQERRGSASTGNGRKQIFRWSGDDSGSQWVVPAALKAGDTIVVPASYGGVDDFGWNPLHVGPAADLGAMAAEPFSGRRYAVRVAPGLLTDPDHIEALADALAEADSRRWQDLRRALDGVHLSEEIRRALAALDDAKAGRVLPYLDLYGTDAEGRLRGVIFVAPLGIRKGSEEEEGRPNATEDDTCGSLPGFALSLVQHCTDVEAKAGTFARAAGLPEARVSDLTTAGFLHDAGKVDPRFQAWLRWGDPLGPDLEETAEILAKSDRPLPWSARGASGLPESWRHEALSVRLAMLAGRLAEAADPELVLWLIGTHHGYGRPFFPHADPADAVVRTVPSLPGLPRQIPPGAGPTSLSFEWRGMDWATLFVRLKARYGVWELARMEAVLRLADHRASEEAARRTSGGDPP